MSSNLTNHRLQMIQDLTLFSRVANGEYLFTNSTFSHPHSPPHCATPNQSFLNPQSPPLRGSHRARCWLSRIYSVQWIVALTGCVRDITLQCIGSGLHLSVGIVREVG